jgi:small conductance mechanosensitive channel
MGEDLDLPKRLDTVLDQLAAVATSYGIDVLGGIALLVAGWLGARWASYAVGRSLRRARQVDDTLVPVLQATVRIGVLALTFVTVLHKFGVEAASLIAVLGAVGLGVGLAMQGTLSNVAAGLMLLTLRPIKVQELIRVRDVMGTVEAIGLFNSQVRTFQGQQVHIPNHQIWSSEITNYTRSRVRRIDLVVAISYGSDIGRALEAARQTLADHPAVLDEPAPVVGVGELADSSVNLYVRPWVRPEDYVLTSMDLLRSLKERFDADGIRIPFPQRDVHLHAPQASPPTPRTPPSGPGA